MDASGRTACHVRLTENQMLHMALDNMPHGLRMFDANDTLLLANRRFAQLWDLPEALTRPGTPYRLFVSELSRRWYSSRPRASKAALRCRAAFVANPVRQAKSPA